MPSETRVSVIGLGYVGLSTAICLASRGFTVYGVEVIPEKLQAIKSGKLPFEEDGLDTLLSRVLKQKRLIPTGDYAEAIKNSSMTFIAVGTPSRPDGSIDLKYVEQASEEIGKELAKKRSYHLVIEKSTVVPGTTQGLVKETLEKSSGKRAYKDFGLCANPEFLRESSAIYDTFHPDAIVIGSEDKKSTNTMLSLYRQFYRKLPNVIITAPSNAELIKYSVNTFRATQLSFLNTIANLSNKVPGADAEEVIRGLSTITKIDPRYLKAGLGYGGSCLPKDVRALIAHSKSLLVNPSLLEAAQEINDVQPNQAIELSRNLIGEITGKNISVLGLAYKAGTDDTRESVAIRLVNSLKEAGANVTVYDPAAMEKAKLELREGINYAKDARSCIKDSECAIIATEWTEFKMIKPAEFKKLMKTPAVVDGRRIYDSKKFKSEGIKFASIGRFEG